MRILSGDGAVNFFSGNRFQGQILDVVKIQKIHFFFQAFVTVAAAVEYGAKPFEKIILHRRQRRVIGGAVFAAEMAFGDLRSQSEHVFKFLKPFSVCVFGITRVFILAGDICEEIVPGFCAPAACPFEKPEKPFGFFFSGFSQAWRQFVQISHGFDKRGEADNCIQFDVFDFAADCGDPGFDEAFEFVPGREAEKGPADINRPG
ncbi:MAG: hypothetical protein BWY32_03695 [bacterium ADurb.Bin243]|nr:MAG: hypothetical protein BWY32_03695 [bacterium ADurb.Bin243]